MNPGIRKWCFRVTAAITSGTVGISGLVLGSRSLEAHVEQSLLDDHPYSEVVFVDLPRVVASRARPELEQRVVPLLDGSWMDDRLCRRIAERIQGCGWVAEVRSVRRRGDGRFEVSCRYREPAAAVENLGRFYLVDSSGVRLPGTYPADEQFKVLHGVSQAPPDAGQVWPGDDLRAGLTLVRLLQGEPFGPQITDVRIENFAGRRRGSESHVDLSTSPGGGRIRWGSAPGHEAEENSVAEKLAILRENFRRTGRADAGYPDVDISTFPDRFTVPDPRSPGGRVSNLPFR